MTPVTKKASSISPRKDLARATQAHSLGRLEEAERLYETVLDHHPGNVHALHQLALLCQQQGRLHHAAMLLERAMAADPGSVEYPFELAMVLQADGRNEKAVAAYRRSLTIRPGQADAHNNLGVALLTLNRLDEAEAAFAEALRLQPNYPEAWSNRGNALRRLERPEEAVEVCDKAIGLRPGYAEAFANLGAALIDLGQLERAEEACAEAIRLAPHMAQAWFNLGNLRKDQGLYAEADELYTHAIKLNPAYATATWNRALTRLMRGHFSDGFSDYRLRPTVDRGREPLPAEPLPMKLEGERLRIIHDQGIGDEIFFLRFAETLKRRGATITYVATAKTAPLLARVAAIDNLLEAGDERPVADRVLSVGDLPFLVGASCASDIPPPLALPPNQTRLAEMRERLAALGPPPYVGVTWRGGIPKKEVLYKAIRFDHLAGVLAPLPVTVVVLQRHPRPGEVIAFAEALGRPAHDFTALNDDLEGMLALLALLDDYVGVSNTNMHLRAASGGACRVAIPFPPEFRWLADGESPWFPEFALYRQPADGDWGAAIGELGRDLQAAFGADRNPQN
jgi:tetratricopeptide (TPR) repeat protein